MPVRAKSIYEQSSPEDGVRVLTTNYWPRGISRERAGTYVRVLGPTRELLRAFKDGAITWPAYRERYLEEMSEPQRQLEIRKLAQVARRETVTVMCVCKEPDQCHRSLLQELIEGAMEEEQ